MLPKREQITPLSRDTSHSKRERMSSHSLPAAAVNPMNLCASGAPQTWRWHRHLLSGRLTEESPLHSPDGDDRECHENSQ
jgi:hypothetical protein